MVTVLIYEPLGKYLHSIIYSGESYDKTLQHFLAQYENTEKKIKQCIDTGLELVRSNGKTITVKKEDIVMEINRCPQVNIGIEPSYFTGFDYISEVLRQGLSDTTITFDKELLKRAIPIYDAIEDNQALHFIAEPAIFSYLG